MRKVLRLAGSATSLVLSLAGMVGLATLPEDIPIFLRRAEGAAMTIDRDTFLFALFGLSALAGAYGLAEPAITRWLTKRRRGSMEFVFPAELLGSGISTRYAMHQLLDVGGVTNYSVRSTYYVGIRNLTDATLHNVRVELDSFTSGNGYFPKELFTEDDTTRANIQPGAEVRFRLGEQWFWRDENDKRIPREDGTWQPVNEPRGGPFFYVNSLRQRHGFLIGGGEFDFCVSAYADDAAPREATLRLTLGPETRLCIVSQSSKRR